MTKTSFSFNKHFCMQGCGRCGLLGVDIFSSKNLWKIKKRQQVITTCCQIKGMLQVSRLSYIYNPQDRKMLNFMLIAPQ